MILVNEKMPNMKFALGKEVVSTDEKGQIEISDKDAIESLKASGFVETKTRFKSAKKEEAPAPESEVAPETAPVMEAEVEAEEAKKEEEPFYKKNKKR
jgi:hypothetical protein